MRQSEFMPTRMKRLIMRLHLSVKNGEQFELDFVLRNNRTSEEFPDGIFHPHPENQHIKRENIGLIEVMGLAVLPPRLKDARTEEVEAYLLGELEQVEEIHQNWADKLKENPEIP